MSITADLDYGLHAAVPADAVAAWGARAIITADGHVDFPPDRMGFAGDRKLMLTLFDAFPFPALRAEIATALIEGRIRTRVAEQVTLFADEALTVVANSNASAGYLYLSAFPTPKETS